MLLTYKESINKYGSDYLLKKAIANKEIFYIEKGIYSDNKKIKERELISFKYPNAVYSDRSAFYYHDLSDNVPDKYYLATKRTDSRITDNNIKQQYIDERYFKQGVEESDINNTKIKIYNQERMLVELIRLKNKYPLDFYKEVINNYRKRTYELDFTKIEEYASLFRNKNQIMKTIQMEVL